MRLSRPLASTLLICLLAGSGQAETASGGAPAAGCNAAQATPATKPAPAAADGTAPGNAGSTGWSGGTGGSYVGTVPAGNSPDARTWQPATARGLDPFAPQPAAAKAC